MEGTSKSKEKNGLGNREKHICIGILAHVDAGKTTLAEGILYQTGQIRKWGRVDHKDAFLDTHVMEKERGITIFSKQAELKIGDKQVTLLDTPGHVDFSAEMERTLQVLDYAILVISGSDGVQGHVETLWYLLKHYHIPVFLFVNKMDLVGTERDRLMEELKQRLSDDCEDFTSEDQDFGERIALHDEKILEAYLEGIMPGNEDISSLVKERKLFPCFFGSALKMEGVQDLLDGLNRYMVSPVYSQEFGARVYKISRDSAGMRLTHLKVTGGTLKVKMRLDEDSQDKAEQIRIYSGTGFQNVTEAGPGTICALIGPRNSFAGQGLGMEKELAEPVLEPVLTYRLQPQIECDMHSLCLKLRELEEEIPEMHIVWEEVHSEIHVQIMGEVQMDILKELIKERFEVPVSFSEGSIVYKETIAAPVEGIGHFEPLRHYAEVHLLLEPGQRGEGLQFAAECSEDMLDINWQRLILTHLEEKKHRGVLTGSEITDMRITLIAGRAHQKHTEGGDFRQATYRAVRQGLRKAETILLEPVYEFRMEVPQECIGRALSDVQRMSGSFEPPVLEGDHMVLTGSAPVVCMGGYQTELLSYTGGRGRLFCTLKGYEPCHNQEEIVEKVGYDPEADTENPTGSVFCAHGAGFTVSWDQVENYMHVEGIRKREETEEISELADRKHRVHTAMADEEELQAIFARTYGTGEKRTTWKRTVNSPSSSTYKGEKKKKGKEYLLVDGYNIIFAWEELKELAKDNIQAARGKLMDILCNYQGYRKMTLILVFDAYKVPGYTGEVQKYHNIYVVYTKEAETADQYIEKAVHEMAKEHKVTVATSDGLEQIIIMGQGARRLSAQGLLREIQETVKEMRIEHMDKPVSGKTYLSEIMPEEILQDGKSSRS